MEPHALTAPHTGHTTGTTHTTGAGHHFTTQTQEGTRTARTHPGGIPCRTPTTPTATRPHPPPRPATGSDSPHSSSAWSAWCAGSSRSSSGPPAPWGLIGFVLGLAGRSRAKKGIATNRKAALSGVLLSLAAFALGVWGLVTVVTAVGDAAEEIDKELNNGSAAVTAPYLVPARH
ncbi:hypothetical protein ACWV95_15975 [Streptomyces albus]